jgi:hypothetical protein
LAPGTDEHYSITVNQFSDWYQTTTGLPFAWSDWSAARLSEFLWHLHDDRKLVAKTINGRRGDLLTFARYAKRRGLAEAIDPEEVIRFREPERIPDGWSQEELAAQLAACDRFVPLRPLEGWDRRHDRAIRLVIYDTAYRLHACMELRPDNLRADGAIMATAETQKTFCDEDKWLGPDTLREVQAILADRQPPDNRPIFAWPRSMPAFWYRWKKINALANLPTTRRDGPQKMRRTSASWIEYAKHGSAEHHLRHKTPGLAKKHYIDPRIAYADNKACDLLPRIVDPQGKLF